MPDNRQNRRSPAETMWIHLLLHLGFSKPLLAEAPLRDGTLPFTRKSIERASEIMEGRLSWQEHHWPIRPSNKVPGRSITSNVQLIEISILAAAMHYLYDDRVYEEISMAEIIGAFDFYTNVRDTAANPAARISPDTTFYLARELLSHKAFIPYCPSCKIRYYSSLEQKIKMACPFCKTEGQGDGNLTFHPVQQAAMKRRC